MIQFTALDENTIASSLTLILISSLCAWNLCAAAIGRISSTITTTTTTTTTTITTTTTTASRKIGYYFVINGSNISNSV